MSLSHEIVNMMMSNDFFSQWLGIDVIETGSGTCKLRLTVRREMLNGFGIAHGAITYAIADSALAFASNSHGQKSVSVETSISHTQPLKEGDIILAEACEEHRSNKIAIYTVKVINLTNNEVVALFKGTVYRTSQNWLK